MLQTAFWRKIVWPVLAAALLTGALVFTGWTLAGAQPEGISLDSSAVSSSGNTLSTINLTVKANDVVVVDVNLSPQSVAARSCPSTPVFPTCIVRAVVSGVSSPGMTFQQRFAWLHTNPDATWMWRYWAVASATGTAAITVSVNSSATWTVIGYSISGANTTSPWDAGLSSSSYRYSPTVWNFNDCNQQDGCFVGYSTTGTSDMILAEIGSEGNPSATAPPGLTLINQVVGNGYLTGAAAYEIVSSPQSHAEIGSWGLSTGESALWTADAVVAATVASSTSTTTTTSTSSSSSTSFTSSSSSSNSSSSSSSSTSSSSTTSSTSTSMMTSTSETLVTSTCTVIFTVSDGNVTGWSGVC
ncbi:MAG: hypothetical protein OK449_02910 [Thaumarchaeota archaeon]|nr:hypothetical protein [Nitrososphaerota archaeon]